MKQFILITFIIFFSIELKANDQLKPRHFVFLVHGIGSKSSTFGVMKEALIKESESLRSQTQWQFHNFEYATGDDEKNIIIFSEELGHFIAGKFAESGGLRPTDKFSLLMHSQGGLIGLNFLIKAFQNDRDFHPELKNHLDAFVTMGTPYWGAKIAIFANRIMPILSYLRIPFANRLGDEELKDMELASDFSAEMRNQFIDPKNQESISALKNQGRFLVISGVTERLNILAPFVTGKNRYEDDTAVPIPSSRLDFIYYSDKFNSSKNLISEKDFKETSFIKKDNYVVVNAFHASPLPQSKKFSGIAKIPNRCSGIDYLDCDHPSYSTVVEHLFDLEQSPKFVRDLTSFAIDLKINFDGHVFKRSQLTLSFKSLTTGLKVGKDVELYNKVDRWTDEGDFRLYHTGYIDSKRTSTSAGKIELIISAPGFQEKKVIIPVKSTMSTFVELNLEKVISADS